MSITCSAEDLKTALDRSRTPTVLDVRWALGDPDGHQHYLDAHIPGAVFVDLDTDLAQHGSSAEGRHPLPSIARLQACARQWGISAGAPIVVYDNTGNLAASRAWWLLRWAGITDVTLLDGGLGAWTSAGHDTASGEERPPIPGDIVLVAGHLPTLTTDEVAAQAESGILLDARAADRYSGDKEPIDPRAGHIPGASSVPTAANIDKDGFFLPANLLRKRFGAVGIDASTAVGVYCGSGVTASHQIAALAIAGIDAALYPGSWSQWSNDPTRHVAIGTSAR